MPPSLDCVYKLQEYADQPRRKRSQGKETWPGRKQVYRHYMADGTFSEDWVTVEADVQSGDPLLIPVMLKGQRVNPPESLDIIRDRTAKGLACLPAHLKNLATEPSYPVRISPALEQLADQVDRKLELNKP